MWGLEPAPVSGGAASCPYAATCPRRLALPAEFRIVILAMSTDRQASPRINTEVFASMVRQVDHNERRTVFANAALQVITRLGIEGLTVREVAREAGYTTGALTHYFRSKDELLIAASEHAAYVSRGDMDQVAEHSSALEGLRRLVYSVLPTSALTRDRWRFWMAFWERAAHSPEVGKVMRERYREWTKRLTGLLKRAQQDGEIGANLNVDHAARELVALIDGIAVQVLIGSSRFTGPLQRQYVDSLLDLRLSPGPNALPR